MQANSNKNSKNTPYIESKISEYHVDMMVSILLDDDMSEYFISEEQNINNSNEETAESISVESISTTRQRNKAEDLIQKDEDHLIQKDEDDLKNISTMACKTTRLEIEIEKHHFDMNPITGQNFITLMGATLQGKDNKHEVGKLMVTNYRILFWKESKKMIDLPFGLIQSIDSKKGLLICKLKQPHQWKFLLHNESQLNLLTTYISTASSKSDLYNKASDIKHNFAFTYASKSYHVLENQIIFNINSYYDKIHVYALNDQYIICDNAKFQTCQSYPPLFYIHTPNKLTKNYLNIIASHRKFHRFPVIAFIYKNLQNKTYTPLWISSDYQDDSKKIIDHNLEKQMLSHLKPKTQKLYIFVGHAKPTVKVVDESMFNNECEIVYLQSNTLEELKWSYNQIIEVFLFQKKCFMKEIFNSRWYEQICLLLKNAYEIVKKMLMECTVLIRCQTGYDRTLQLISLVMIILDPYYRTFEGFSTLVMSLFINFGHPFSQRLGEKVNKHQDYPIFIQFLDCVTQLIQMNPLHFEYNSKYLSKLANLLYTNIYGTFIANSPKEYYLKEVEKHTVSIWPHLINLNKKNGFYQKKYGILEVHSELSSLKLWKEHFGTMITKNKDHYKKSNDAEDTRDYVNLECLRVKAQNQALKLEINRQLQEINAFKLKL